MVTPRFSPTAFLHSFEKTKTVGEDAPPPCWSERVLWKSLPGVEDLLSLELYNKRDVVCDEGNGRVYDHDAIVAGFVVTSALKLESQSARASCMSVLSLHATLLPKPTQQVLAGTELFVSFTVQNDETDDELRTSLSTLGAEAPVLDNQKCVGWYDNVKIPLTSSSKAGMKASDHVFVRINAIRRSPSGDTTHVPVGGCVLSVRKLVGDPTSPSTTQDGDLSLGIDERLISAGYHCGWLRGRISLTLETRDDSTRSEIRQACGEGDEISGAGQKTRTPTFKSVSKGLRSIMFRKRKK